MAKKPFQPGISANPRGRRKGSVNKFTTLKAAFLNVFERAGGEDGLLEWVNASNHNKAAFYQWITKMLPVEVKQSGEISHVLSFDFGENGGNGHEIV